MKNSKTILFLLIILCLLPFNSFSKPALEPETVRPSSSLEEDTIEPGKIYVQFTSSYIQMPAGKTTAAFDEVAFNNSELEKIFKLTRISKLHHMFTFMKKIPSQFENVYCLSFDESQSVRSVMQMLSLYPKYFKRIEPVSKVVLADVIEPVPDPRFGEQWALENTGQTGGIPGSDISALEAWETTRGSSDVVIAVVDTGVKYTHEDLADNILKDENGKVIGWDFGEDDDDPYDEKDGHGTLVSGTAAAVTMNGKGVSGVCPNCKIMPIKGTQMPEAIVWAVEHGADIINMSWGTGEYLEGYGYSTFWYDVFSYVYEKDVVLVAAAGNDAKKRIKHPQVVGVSAIDHKDQLASFTNYGNWVSVAAPGVNVICVSILGEGYAYSSGTSVSSPIVAGIAGLIKSRHPEYHVDEIISILQSSVDQPNSPWSLFAGTGRINAAKAVAEDHPAIVRITHLEEANIISGAFHLYGTVGGQEFVGYEVGVGIGQYPSEYQNVCIGSEAKTDEILCSIDTTPYPEDTKLTIKLTAVNRYGSTAFDLVEIQVNNLRITSPFSGEIKNTIEPLVIKGFAAGPGFKRYEIDYKAGDGDAFWTKKGLSLISNGLQPVQEGILGYLDTTQFIQPTVLQIRLTGYYQDNSSQDMVYKVIVDPRLRPGWPQVIPWFTPENKYYQVIDRGSLTPVTANLDNQGDKEILVYPRGNPPELFIYNSNGSLKKRIPVGPKIEENKDFLEFLKTQELGKNYTPVIGNMLNKGSKEIVVARYYSDKNTEIFAFNNQGQVLRGFPVTLNSADPMPSLTLADLDLDGHEEIIVKENSGFNRELTIINYRGEAIMRRVISQCSGDGFGNTAVGNFDDDPELEIVFKYLEEETRFRGADLTIINYDGTELEGWPQETPFEPENDPIIIGDVNNDGKEEIVSIHPLKIIDRYGRNLIEGSPVYYCDSVSLMDKENDHYLEVVCDTGHYLHIINHQGQNILDPPISKEDDYGRGTFGSNILIGDYDGDGISDLLNNFPINNMLAVWNIGGILLDDFSFVSNVIIDDIDNDQKLDIIGIRLVEHEYDDEKNKPIPESRIYIWESPHQSPHLNFDWPMPLKDTERTGRY